MTASTECRTCENVTLRTREKDGWLWRCSAYPVPDVEHFLGKGVRGRPPHLLCIEMNDGMCPHWTPRRSKEDPDGRE